MITLIGFKCKRSNALSLEVLMFRFLLRNLEITKCVRRNLPQKTPPIKKDGVNLNIMFWCFDGGATPLPIPNREVKPASGDDSLHGKSS